MIGTRSVINKTYYDIFNTGCPNYQKLTYKVLLTSVIRLPYPSQNLFVIFRKLDCFISVNK
jgi:hypothetical protein